jgi:hypothetical protein
MMAAGTTMSPIMLMPSGTLAAAAIAAPSHPRRRFDMPTTLATNVTSA